MTIASIIAALIGGASGITYGVVKRNQKDAAQYAYDEFTNANLNHKTKLQMMSTIVF